MLAVFNFGGKNVFHLQTSPKESSGSKGQCSHHKEAACSGWYQWCQDDEHISHEENYSEELLAPKKKGQGFCPLKRLDFDDYGRKGEI